MYLKYVDVSNDTEKNSNCPTWRALFIVKFSPEQSFTSIKCPELTDIRSW